MKNIVLAMATEGIDISMLSVAEEKIIEAIDALDHSNAQFQKVTCDYQENVLNSCKRSKADALIISEKLPGRKDLIDVIKEVKNVMPNIKIIVLLIKEREVGDLMLAKLAMLGVYNWLPSPWKPYDIAKLVVNPRQLSDVEQYMPKLVENDGVISMVISNNNASHTTGSENTNASQIKRLEDLEANASTGKDLSDVTPKDKWSQKEEDTDARNYNSMMKSNSSLFSHQAVSQRYHEINEDSEISFNSQMSEDELMALIKKPKDKFEARDDMSFDMGTDAAPAQAVERKSAVRQYQSIAGTKNTFADLKKDHEKMVNNVSEVNSGDISFDVKKNDESVKLPDTSDHVCEKDTAPHPVNSTGNDIRAKLNNQQKGRTSSIAALQKREKANALLAEYANLMTEGKSKPEGDDQKQAVQTPDDAPGQAVQTPIAPEHPTSVKATVDRPDKDCAVVEANAKEAAAEKSSDKRSVAEENEQVVKNTNAANEASKKDKENIKRASNEKTQGMSKRDSKDELVIDMNRFSNDAKKLAKEVSEVLERSRNFNELSRNYHTAHHDEYIELERERCMELMRKISGKKDAATIWEAFTPDPTIKTIFCCSILPLSTSIPVFLAQAYRKIGRQVNLVDLTRDGSLLHSTRTSALEGVVTTQSTFNKFTVNEQDDAITIVYGVAGHGVNGVIERSDKNIIIAPNDIRAIRKFIDKYGEMFNKDIMVIEPACDLSLRKTLEPMMVATKYCTHIAYIRCVNSIAPRTLLTGKIYNELMNETCKFADNVPYVSQAFIVLTALCEK